jgi:uncharacterized protein (DUF58 family)
MKLLRRFINWLESNWATPSFAGWVLAVIALAFFGAATNTMAGWLYAISGVSFAMLGLGAVLAARSLRSLEISRLAIAPISADDQIAVEILIKNPTLKPKSLLQIHDLIPHSLGDPPVHSIETIAPQATYHWRYSQPAPRRGVYWWQEIQAKTAAPLGLFWSRRIHTAKAKAIVYPIVLPLNTCPLIDEMGREDDWQVRSDRYYQAATEGVTKALRPYRAGDPTRLIHWRTSARYGELKVRELEVVTGSQAVVIALDNTLTWHGEDFEQAVTAAASLYFYAARRQLEVQLWTGDTGLVHGNQVVLETLAATNFGVQKIGQLPDLPLIWLTANPANFSSLPLGSRWILWTPADQPGVMNQQFPGVVIDRIKPLQSQLQQPL